MLKQLKSFFNKVWSGCTRAYRSISCNKVLTMMVCFTGLISTHTVMHLFVLTGATLFAINMLHLLCVLGFVLVALSKINQLKIFDGKVKLMTAPAT